METKTCNECKAAKILTDYRCQKGKYDAKCKDCTNARRRELSAKKRLEGPKIVSMEYLNSIITCSKCNQEKKRSEFTTGKNQCKDCIKMIKKEYDQSQRGKENNAQWIENNREHLKEYHTEWHQENKERINEKYVQRYHSDPEFKFKRSCKTRILNAFKSQNLAKSNKTIEYLNCDIPWLVKWFILCFTPEMTLENHGSYWHMDHVIPVNTFNLSDPEQITLCFSWFNLSQLQANENMSKHDSINVQQIQQHVQKLTSILSGSNYNIQKYIDLCARHFTMTGSPLELYLPLQ